MKYGFRKAAIVLISCLLVVLFVVSPGAAENTEGQSSLAPSPTETGNGTAAPSPSPSPSPAESGLPSEGDPLPGDTEAPTVMPSPGGSESPSTEEPLPDSTPSAEGSADPSPSPSGTAEDAVADATVQQAQADELSIMPMAPPSKPRDIKTELLNGGTIITGGGITFSKNGRTFEPDPVTGLTNVPADADGNFNFDFSIPPDITQQLRAGDYYDIELPPEFNISAPLSNVPLVSSDGVNYATLSVFMDTSTSPPTPKARITFTDKAASGGTLNGEIHFTAKMDPSNISDAGPGNITFPSEPIIPDIPVNIQPAGATAIEKSGQFVDFPNPNPTQIKWTIDVNKALNNLTAPVMVRDLLPPGVDPSTVSDVSVVQLHMDGQGNATPGASIPYSQIPVSGSTVGFELPNDLANTAARITFTVNIDPAQKPQHGGSMSFTNRASLTAGNQPTPVSTSSSLTTSYKKPLQKKNIGYTQDGQKARWQVVYDTDRLGTQGFTDTYEETPSTPPVMQLNTTIGGADGIVAYAAHYDENGKLVIDGPLNVGIGPASGVTGANGVEFTDDSTNGQFTGGFPNGVDPSDAPLIVLQYTTYTDDPIYGDVNVTNEIETTGTVNDDSGAGTTIRQPWISKGVESHTVGDNDLTWYIDINREGKRIYSGATITDTLPAQGLDTVNVTFNPNPSIAPTVNVVGNIVTITLNEDLLTPMRISVHTTYDIGQLPDVMHNSANMTWTDADGSHSSNASSDFKPDQNVLTNGGKRGTYNHDTKQITWRVWTNYNNFGLQDARIEDPIKINEGQSYVAGSVQVYTYDVDTSSTEPVGLVNLALQDLYNTPGLRAEEPTDANGQKLTVYLPDTPITTSPTLPTRYLVEYETTLDGTVVREDDYTNTATVYNKNYDDTVLNASVGVKRGGELISKSGYQDGNGYAQWKLEINASQSELENAVVTDTLSTIQHLIESTLEVQNATVDADGKLTAYGSPLVQGTDYTYTYTEGSNGNVLVVRFTNTIKRPYIITFSCSMLVPDNETNPTATNEATLTGKNNGNKGDDTNSTINVDLSRGGGTITGTPASLTMRKLDRDSRPLAGAIFQLFDKNGNAVGPERTVGANGTLTWDGLVTGMYTLREIKPPPGCNPTIETLTGIVVDVESGENMVRVYNVPDGINLSKENADGDLLAGAEFILQRQNETTKEWTTITDYDPLVIGQNGVLLIEGLPEDVQYRFIETKAPEGYILNTTPLPFWFDREGPEWNYEILPVHVGPQVNYQGRVELVKSDDSGALVAGVTFSLYQKPATEPIATAVTDTNGLVVFDHLAPGDYTLVETATAPGLVIDDTPMQLTVPDEYAGEFPITRLNFTNHAFRGDVHITKTDNKGNVLEGAIFQVLDDEGTVVVDEIETNEKGIAVVIGLAPGDYSLREAKAPEGYFADKTTYLFTVEYDPNGQVNALTVQIKNEPTPAQAAAGTGDNTQLALFVVLAAGAATALILVSFMRKRKKARQ